MTHTVFNLLEFRPMTFRDWRSHYRRQIGVMIWLSSLKKVKTGLHVCTPDTELYLPKYKAARDPLAAKPKQIAIGDRPILIRIPAVKVGPRFLILDGCHRLNDLRPGLVVLDYVEPTKRQRRAFMDLNVDWWVAKR